ncbi:MAG: bifunctional riboflavin kinase/FAD synthetase [Kiloniellaceae bacterium]
MAIFRHTTDLPTGALGPVLAIGNFDGVHRGHQAVIEKAGRLARAFETTQAVLTFEPHPRRFFQPDAAPFELTPFRLKARLIEALGVDNLFVLRFDRALSRMSAQDFVRDILVAGLRVRHVVVGDNFAFGHKRRGDLALLQRLGLDHGFGVSGLTRVTGPLGQAYSSTRVRDCLKAGDPTRAALLLGRYWEIEGRILRGDRRGRQLGFPTANIKLNGTLEPARGVYAVRAGIDRRDGPLWHDGVANLGVRPTVDGERLLLEVHLFDLDQDLYGRHMRVALVDYLRPEIKFDGLDSLKAQIAEDGRRARVILDREAWDSSWPASPSMSVTAEPNV